MRKKGECLSLSLSLSLFLSIFDLFNNLIKNNGYMQMKDSTSSVLDSFAISEKV